MTDSRTEQVNRALEARRRLMNKRIMFGRILLWIWAPAVVLNLMLFYLNANIRLPISSTTADFWLMLRVLNSENGLSVLLYLPIAMVPAGIVAASIFWKKQSALRTGVFLLLWADMICMIAAWLWNPILLFGDNSLRHWIAVANLIVHIFWIWHISRARRAVESLEILPEREYEGDPYEEFRNKASD